jgi:hypothetical protein
MIVGSVVVLYNSAYDLKLNFNFNQNLSYCVTVTYVTLLTQNYS